MGERKPFLLRVPEELLEELLRTRPAGEDLVFTHGDYCLPNVLIDGQRLGGFIDMGRAGVADQAGDRPHPDGPP